ncbi:hypothetical protein LAWI1_G001363 [Lachnellula willkommii]|uniref:NAD(P)-binding domain-containing protein n=1 Tax=Lachnellula willkommii TaxID=215461 RepID=A0A559MMI0_9HELO|nr:hypothetical protein LAWI1_G001363 [Lachnellula willkommii]
MRLIVAGATGFVATEVLRQAINNPAITSLVALARRETACPDNAGENATKFTSAVCDDFGNYSEDVKKQLAGANACIWLIAVTPSKLKTMPFDEVRKICLDYTDYGIATMAPLAAKPFRFMYCSGVNAERDQTKKLWIMHDYGLLRGKAEQNVLEFAAASNGAVEASTAKPGMIAGPNTPWTRAIAKTIISTVVGLPRVEVHEIAAAMISGVVGGFEGDTYLNEDLVRVGRKVLESEKSSA